MPGELFVKALGSFNNESVMIQSVDDATILLSSGKSKLKVPTLPVDDFKMPQLKGKPYELNLTDSMLDGIKRCLFSVGTDPTHPAQMGVTMGEVKGFATFYSTDNITISRSASDTKVELPGGMPIILPTFFCEQLLTLAKAYPADDLVLEVYVGALKLKVGKVATLLTKTLVDMEPLDFEDIVSKYLDVNQVKKTGGFARIPAALDSAFSRALLVLSAETDKSTTVEVNGCITISSSSNLGESDDTLDWDGKDKIKPFKVDPGLVLRAAKSSGSVAFYPRVMLLASDDASFIHLIAHMK